MPSLKACGRALVALVLLPSIVSCDEALPTPSSMVTISASPKPYTTTVYENPRGTPIVTWNCAVMPNICFNVGKYAPLDPRDMTIVPSPKTGNHGFLELHYDTDKKAKQARRKTKCGRTVFSSNKCPEGITKLVVGQGINGNPADFAWVDLQGNPGNGAQPGVRLLKGYWPSAFMPLADTRSFIGTTNNQFLGMVWTCEEFPPASSLEGDEVGAVQCAPMHASCAKLGNTRFTYLNTGGEFHFSEQNYQGWSLSRIASLAPSADNKGQSLAWTYRLYTQWVAPTNPAFFAARVSWPDATGTYVWSNYGTKRDGLSFPPQNISDETHVHQVIESIYPNSTTTRLHHLFRREDGMKLVHIHSYEEQASTASEIFDGHLSSRDGGEIVARDAEESSPENFNQCFDEMMGIGGEACLDDPVTCGG